jgi:hypothetical protein
MSAPAAAADIADAPAELLALRSAAAVRERCARVYDWVAAGHSPHFALDETKLANTAELVADVTRTAYPDLVIPQHSRWRHFSPGGSDRWASLPLAGTNTIEAALAAIDLTIVSVLLDAGAGAAWRYRDATTGLTLARSEGLAVATFEMFRAGLFSSDPGRPYQFDRVGLERLALAPLAAAFQVTDRNPLVGLPHRLALLYRLGEVLAARPDLFGTVGRPAMLFLRPLMAARTIAAPAILASLLDVFSGIWPSGLTVDGIALGDAGRHPAARTQDRSDGIVPFHKLSQWLTYSLIEPLERAGLTVTDLDSLTALPEYRNGGLLIDAGVIVPRAPHDPTAPHAVGSELIVEWRALTVALIARLRDPVRRRLGLDALSMAQLLQGGTWSAGRAIAAEKRPSGGPPPIAVAADGTVF